VNFTRIFRKEINFDSELENSFLNPKNWKGNILTIRSMVEKKLKECKTYSSILSDLNGFLIDFDNRVHTCFNNPSNNNLFIEKFNDLENNSNNHFTNQNSKNPNQYRGTDYRFNFNTNRKNSIIPKKNQRIRYSEKR